MALGSPEGLAGVTDNGAVLLGSNFVADSFWRRLVRIVTHAHADHYKGLPSSIRESIAVIATPTTLELLRILGFQIPRDKSLPLEYDRGIAIEEEVVTLRRSRHIAGSAQVEVETSNGRAGYTGDFKLPGTPPMTDLDVLVIDATYGSPRFERRWSDSEALDALALLVEKHVKNGPVWVYGYHGKLQEVMVELRRRGVKHRFLADYKTVRMVEAASRYYNYDVGDVGVYKGGQVDEPSVVFTHVSKINSKSRMKGAHIVLTGWELKDVVVRVGENRYNVSFSDHATFREVVAYVSEARPKEVIVDAYRGRDAWFTAKYIEKLLGIKARAEP
ncbi:MAG: MBL fold metallo-hydrolase [Desulfurococcales archaeon]|nr:MBL fold metallo-hydrolase [Desulfurococcales archaeon]